MNEVVISVGSNINPELNVKLAKETLNKISVLLRVSQFYITNPWDLPNNQIF